MAKFKPGRRVTVLNSGIPGPPPKGVVADVEKVDGKDVYVIEFLSDSVPTTHRFRSMDLRPA